MMLTMIGNGFGLMAIGLLIILWKENHKKNMKELEMINRILVGEENSLSDFAGDYERAS